MSPNRKAPSAGQKVTLGENAPVTLEGAGYVDAASLAAESYNKGGEFASNRGAAPDSGGAGTGGRVAHVTQASGLPRSSGSTGGGGKGGQADDHRAAPQEEQGGIAPSYVNSQYMKDPKGPHGKRIREGFEYTAKYKDGMKKAIYAEPGSEDDPSRLAEQVFLTRVAGTGLGPAEAKAIEGGYEVLKLNESA